MTGLADLPAGTVTFLFTDLEGSTALLQAHPHAYRDAVARHHDLLRGAVEAHGGVVFETVGDAVYAAFARPTDAVAAALAGQRALLAEGWGELGAGALKARMGLHSGEVECQGAHYFGAALYRCARLMATAHGGQAVLSQAACDLVRDALPAGAGLRDLGEYRLKDLARPERVFQLTAPGLPGDFPPLRTLDARPHNLPLQLTSFVGRERELAAVAALLGAHRLVTLTGPGGTGKTRLALQAAADALEGHPDGAWLAELAALADPALVPQAVAQAVGVREEPGRPLLATLTDALRPRRLLVVLDNCEHLLDACARLADALLRACPELTLLATSREALGIAGEAPYRVPSLSLPAAPHAAPAAALPQSEAVRLFTERATVAQPAFALTARNAAAVVELCRRLDGIPLALELAAARVRVLPVEQLLGRLEDRFRLLTGGSRTALERHQTLQAAVDWSYDLLGAPERALFARLAVFAGGFSLEAAEAVGAGGGIEPGEVLDLLTRLVDTSLVEVDAPPDGAARYRLLETLRQYGRQRLAAADGTAAGQAAAVSERHAAYYLDLTEALEAPLRGPDQVGVLDRLDADHENLRAALRWFADAGTDGAALAGLRLAGALWQFWWIRGHWQEGQEWLRVFLDAPAAAGRARARPRAAAGRGILMDYLDDHATARRLYEESLGLCRALGDRPGEAFALAGLGHLARNEGDLPAARRLVQQSLALARAAGDRAAAADALRHLGEVASFAGAWDEARRAYEEGLALARAAGDLRLAARCVNGLATALRGQGDLDAARPLFEEALAAYRRLGDRRSTAFGLHGLGQLHRDRGAPDAAEPCHAEALTLLRDIGDRRGVALSLRHLAHVAQAQGRAERALRLAGAFEALRHSSGAPFRTPDAGTADERLATAARQQLGQAPAAVAWAAGQAMTPDEAIAYALEDTPAPA